MNRLAEDYRQCALAVEQTLPPTERAHWAERSLSDVVTDAMVKGEGGSELTPWWRASAPAAISAVRHMTGLDEGTASTIVGAVVHALRVTGGDLTQANAIERAIRAAFWHLGRRYGNTEHAFQADTAPQANT